MPYISPRMRYSIKLHSISTSTFFIVVFSLCWLLDLPLVFKKETYNINQSILLLGFSLMFSIGLILICLPVLEWLQDLLNSSTNQVAFYLIGSLLALHILVGISGTLESFIISPRGADPLFYYKCIGNSCVYIFSGNTTVVLICWLYVKKIKLKSDMTKLSQNINTIGNSK